VAKRSETELVINAQPVFFRVLVVQPFAGRPFASDEDAAQQKSSCDFELQLLAATLSR
jgi:hypothetical protein